VNSSRRSRSPLVSAPIRPATPADIERAVEGRFDLVVLDLSLGEVDGIEVMSRLGARHRGMPVILVSGADQSLLDTAGRIAEMHKLRVIGTFAKPFSLDVLRTAMLEWSQVSDQAHDPTGPRVVVGPDELLDSEFLHLVYQPKVSTVSGEVTGVEALVRWRHPTHGDVSPSVFVALIEEAGRTSELLDSVMAMASRDRLRYRALKSMPDVSVNISVLDLDDEELPRRAQRMLTEAAPADAWTFEVTETAPFTDAAPALSILTRLRLAGFRLAVDDFGTGTSNYERVLAAPFTELKIDRAMVGRLRHPRIRARPHGEVGGGGRTLARLARGGRRSRDARSVPHGSRHRMRRGSGLSDFPSGGSGADRCGSR